MGKVRESLGKPKAIAEKGSLERPVPVIESCILLIRGQKVLLDEDLAALYGVPTGRLNEAVKRNRERFPDDFMFQLTLEEGKVVEGLRSQIAILKQAESKSERGRHRKYAPYVFTEQGIAMLSSVLRSPRAIQVNIAIVRTFVRLRQLLAAHEEIAEKTRDSRMAPERAGTADSSGFRNHRTIDATDREASRAKADWISGGANGSSGRRFRGSFIALRAWF